MKASTIAVCLVLAVAAGCSNMPTSTGAGQGIEPSQAVQSAAAAAPRGVAGVFAMRVKATGTQNGYLYLNSESDYRDQRNLTIAITPSAAQHLQVRLGSPPGVALDGKRILVKGVAARRTIYFLADGKPTDKYYYQTHVEVTSANQIQVVGQGG